jgi:uncharacterized protein
MINAVSLQSVPSSEEAISNTAVRQVSGVRKFVYISLGLFFVGMGYLGAILPGLPTTPWLLLASYFFTRSSPRLEAWLRKTPYFGSLITDWEAHRGIRPRIKISAICMIVLVVGYTVLFSRAPIWVKYTAGSAASLGVFLILFVVKTVRDVSEEEKNRKR